MTEEIRNIVKRLKDSILDSGYSYQIIVHLKIRTRRFVEQHPASAAKHLYISLIVEREAQMCIRDSPQIVRAVFRDVGEHIAVLPLSGAVCRARYRILSKAGLRIMSFYRDGLALAPALVPLHRINDRRMLVDVVDDERIRPGHIACQVACIGVVAAVPLSLIHILPPAAQEAVMRTMDAMEPAQTQEEIREMLEGTQKGGVKNSIKNLSLIHIYTEK